MKDAHRAQITMRPNRSRSSSARPARRRGSARAVRGGGSASMDIARARPARGSRSARRVALIRSY